MIVFWSLMVVFTVGMLIATTQADLDYALPQWLLVSLVTLSSIVGLVWQVRALVALRRTGRKPDVL